MQGLAIAEAAGVYVLNWHLQRRRCCNQSRDRSPHAAQAAKPVADGDTAWRNLCPRNTRRDAAASRTIKLLQLRSFADDISHPIHLSGSVSAPRRHSRRANARAGSGRAPADLRIAPPQGGADHAERPSYRHACWRKASGHVTVSTGRPSSEASPPLPREVRHQLDLLLALKESLAACQKNQ